MTFEDIKKANETIMTTDIKGKQYSEVNQRIKAFRMVYPTGFIKTEMVSNESDENGVHTCIFRTQVGYILDSLIEGTKYLDEIILATGTAYEKEDSTFINKTSYIENCETSAVGRALGMAGFGIDTSVASAEEVQNAIINQNNLKTLASLDRPLKDKLVEHYGKDITKLTEEESKEAIESLKRKGLI